MTLHTLAAIFLHGVAYYQDSIWAARTTLSPALKGRAMGLVLFLEWGGEAPNVVGFIYLRFGRGPWGVKFREPRTKVFVMSPSFVEKGSRQKNTEGYLR